MGKDLPLMTTIEELKKDVAREEQKKLISKVWIRTDEDWTKKQLGLLILSRWSINTQ